MDSISNWKIVKSTEQVIEAIKEFNTNTKAFFQAISTTIYYLTHPKELAWMMWSNLVKYSFWICMFICLFSVIAYICGWKKGKLWARGSIFAYIIIVMFNSVLA